VERLEQTVSIFKQWGARKRTDRALRLVKGAFISIARGLLLFGLAFIIMYPLLYMLSVSFRRFEDLYDPTVVWIPRVLTLENIRFTIDAFGYYKGLARTLSISLLASILQTLVCAVTGYGFARFRFKGRNALFFLALFTLIVPPQTINMPLYINYVGFTTRTRSLFEDGIKIIDTIIPIALPALMGTGVRSGLFIYIFRQYFKNMPVELEEAGYLDGCGPISAFARIMLVNAGPALLVSFLFSFVWYWNDYLNVSLFFTSARPMSILLVNFVPTLNAMRTESGAAFTPAQTSVYAQVAMLLFITPVLLIYLFAQKRFTESIVRSGIVG